MRLLTTLKAFLVFQN